MLIKKEKRSKDEERIITDYKDEFKRIFTNRINKAGKLDTLELNNDTYYKVYYLFNKKVTRTKPYDYIVKKFKAEKFADLLFDDIYIYNYNIEGQGNYLNIDLPYEKTNKIIEIINEPVIVNPNPVDPNPVNPNPNLVKPIKVKSKNTDIEQIIENLKSQIIQLSTPKKQVLKQELEQLIQSNNFLNLTVNLEELIQQIPQHMQDKLRQFSLKEKKYVISNLLQLKQIVSIPSISEEQQKSRRTVINANQNQEQVPQLVGQSGGRQVICNIYESFDKLISVDTPEQIQINKEILVSALCAKLSYLNLGFYLAKPNTNRNYGYLNFKNTSTDAEIINEYCIDNISLHIANDKRTSADVTNLNILNQRYINTTGKPDKNHLNSINNYFYTNPQNINVPTPNNNKSHLISLYKWLDTEKGAESFSVQTMKHILEKLEIIIKCSDIPIVSNNLSDMNNLDDDDDDDDKGDDTDDASEQKASNIGMIRYYLMYDMHIKKFLFSIRGTDFGGSAGIDNFGINIQFGLYNMRKYYKDNCKKENISPAEEKCILDDLYNFGFQIIVDAIYELQLTLPFLKNNIDLVDKTSWFGAFVRGATLGAISTTSNNVSGMLIHILYSNGIKELFENIIKLLVTADKDNPNLLNYLDSELKIIRDKLGKKLFPKTGIFDTGISLIINFFVLSEKDFKETTDKIITRFLTIFVKYTQNSYLTETIKYSNNILIKCKQIIKAYGYDNKDLIITGHSLGGGLSQILGGLQNIRAYTYNPAPTRSALARFERTERYEFKHKSKSSLLTRISDLTTSVFTKDISLFMNCLVTKFTYFNPTKNFRELSFLYEDNIKNMVIAQDYIHKIKLTSDFNRLHIGKVYVVSEPIFEKFYKESYIIKGPKATFGHQVDNVTSFHGIEEFFLLLSKIFNYKGICLDDINPEIYNITRYDSKNDFFKVNPNDLVPVLLDTTESTTLDIIGDKPPIQTKEEFAKIVIKALVDESYKINNGSKTNKDEYNSIIDVVNRAINNL